MGKKRSTGAIKPMAYQLPEDEFRLLKQTRDHLLLLSDMAAPMTHAEAGEHLALSRDAVAHCFGRLAGELDEVIREVWWPGD